MKSFVKLILCMTLLLVCNFVSAQTDAGQVFTLENGLNVFVKPINTTPVVALNFWVKAGSVNEEPGQEGYAHLVERMLLKGTIKFPFGNLDNEIKKMGAKQNAFTANDYTCHYLVGASKYFERMLELESDAIFNSAFDAAELTKEARSVIEEMRVSTDNPNNRIVQMVMEAAFKVHPYRHPIIGYQKNLEEVTREKLLVFHKKYYVPSNMWVVIVGDVDTASAVELIKKYMGDIPKVPAPVQQIPPEPPQNGMRVKVESAELQNSYIRMGWRVPGIESVDKYALYVVARLVGGGNSSWLWKELVERQELAVSAGAGYYSSQFPMLFQVGGVTSPGKSRQFTEEARKIIYRLIDGEISNEEIERAKQQIIAEDIFDREKAENQATNYGHFAMIADVRDSDTFVDNIRSVNIEDIRRVATEYLNDTTLTIARLEPKAVASDALPEMITLDNGIRLVLKENHSSPVVSVSVKISAGGMREEQREAGLASLNAEMLVRGANGMSGEDIAENFASLGTKYSSQASKSFVTFNLQSLSENFVKSLDLFLDVLAKPDFPSSELDKMKQQVEDWIKAEEDDLYKYTSQEALMALFVDTPLGYSTNGKIDDVRRIKRQDLVNFHDRYFVGSNMVIAIVGDFYIRELKNRLLSSFARFDAGKSKEPKSYELKDITEPVLVNLKKNRDQSQIVYVARTFPANDDRGAAMTIAQTILSGSMSSRLFQNLRAKDALANSTWAYNVGMFNTGYFLATISTDAAKTATASARLKEEIDLFRDKGFTDQEFEDAKKYVTGQYALTLVDSLSMADNFASDELFGRGFDYYLKYPGLIASTTREQVTEVSQQYLLASGSYVLAITTP